MSRDDVDTLSATPVFRQVADILASRIERGELLPDRPVSSESQLEREFGVARGTARTAIAVLREDGLVVTVKGRGSSVDPLPHLLELPVHASMKGRPDGGGDLPSYRLRTAPWQPASMKGRPDGGGD